MKDITYIESIAATPKGIVSTVFVEDIVDTSTISTHVPIKCTITVPFYYFPEAIDFHHLDEDELEQLLNVYVNLNEFEWIPILPTSDGDKQTMRVFF